MTTEERQRVIDHRNWLITLRSQYQQIYKEHGDPHPHLPSDWVRLTDEINECNFVLNNS